ncbi:proline--tRNA ligase [Methylophilaceae bacterium]|nr:proline--tRNA ligase [Methylophilaceae bacterium]
MRASKFYIATRKESPAEAELLSHQLLVRAGMVRLLGSGLYTIMPLGLRVLKKIEMIIRDELNQAGCIELLMPAIQPADLWKESERWEEFGPQMLKIKDRHEKEFCFGPTHEEVITDIIRKEINSYKQLPINFYQIQMKFRDEIRPRFGVMRAREFLMKDAYSFHTNFDCLKETYQKMFKVYENIFNRIGLKFRAVSADNGAIGGDASHEFHVLAESGEDVLVYDENSDYAANIELAKDNPNIDKFQTCRGIEVGHIFQLGSKYSEKMSANFIAEDGSSKPVIMGCYGIGVSRIVAATIEQSHDDNGIIFPPSIAPFELIITPIGYDKNKEVRSYADKLYDDLIKQGFDVLIDDRGLRPGVMFSEADLIGIPHRVTVGDKTIKENKYEYKGRSEQGSRVINFEELLVNLKNC